MFIIVIHNVLYYYYWMTSCLDYIDITSYQPDNKHTKMAAECPVGKKTEKKESTQCPIGSHVEGSDELDPRNMVLVQLLL